MHEHDENDDDLRLVLLGLVPQWSEATAMDEDLCNGLARLLFDTDMSEQDWRVLAASMRERQEANQEAGGQRYVMDFAGPPRAVDTEWWCPWCHVMTYFHGINFGPWDAKMHTSIHRGECPSRRAQALRVWWRCAAPIYRWVHRAAH